MARLFQSLGRSREHHREQYPPPDDYNRYEPDRSQNSSWRRVLSKRPRDDRRWEEETVQYPQLSHVTSSVPRDYHGGRRMQATVEDYHEEQSQSGVTATDETFDELYSQSDTAIPIVQRENSLSRLRDAFAEHGGAGHRPITELSLPAQAASGYDPAGLPVQGEFQNVYSPAHQPVMVNHTAAESMRPELVQSRHRHPPSNRPRRRDQYAQESYHHGSSFGSEYPPCVVVVKRGRDGEKDTYYIIPGGAPVIFEDEDGNELTRVGDFSGKYRPQPQRPVIIQDQHGREIYRMGFDVEDPLRRSGDSSYGRLPVARGREEDYDGYYRSRNYQERGNSHRSYSSSMNPDYRYAEEDPRYTSGRSNRRSPTSSPDVVYIDPHAKERLSAQHYSRGRSSPRRYEEPHRSYEHPDIVHLDQRGREVSSSGSSRSSGDRSHRSSRR